MIIISRNKQIAFYILILIFGVFFFIYFYKQASISDTPDTYVNRTSEKTVQKLGTSAIKMNLDLFKTDKFKNLRSDSLPVVSFPVGKRNPFEPY